MCEHLGGCSMLERCSPRYVPGDVGASRTEIEHPGKPLDLQWENTNRIAYDAGNRGETPDRAVGSLGHLGYLTRNRDFRRWLRRYKSRSCSKMLLNLLVLLPMLGLACAPVVCLAGCCWAWLAGSARLSMCLLCFFYPL